MEKVKRISIFLITTFMCIMLCGCNIQGVQDTLSEITDKDAWITASVATTEKRTEENTIYDIAVPEDNAKSDEKNDKTETLQIPVYSGKLSVIVNNNVPDLDKKDAENGTFTNLSELDNLGRCGTAYMCAGPETLATEERGEIGHVKPSGWHTVKYPEVIPDRYLYNRSHLLMYALSGLNDDERNLITGTRQLNADRYAGMLHYENIVLDYIKETGNHVLYKVTPVFSGSDLLANGVLMEALSVEDDDVSFCVFVYNVQDGINIDYATGESNLAE